MCITLCGNSWEEDHGVTGRGTVFNTLDSSHPCAFWKGEPAYRPVSSQLHQHGRSHIYVDFCQSCFSPFKFLERESANFSVADQLVNILGVEGHAGLLQGLDSAFAG